MLAIYNQRGQADGAHNVLVPVPVTAGTYAVYGPTGAPLIAQVRARV
jgi:hypothetical protein